MNADQSAELVQAKYLSEAPSPPPGLAPSPPPGLAVSGVFWYIHYKAFGYLELGPDAYRELDAFHLPPPHWAGDKLEAVRRGCEQIVQWRGLSADQPLEGIGVGGFYDLLRLFHFEPVAQSAQDGGGGMILDMMQMKHAVDSREITLYNRVKPVGLQKEPGPPCPYCGGLLRTSKAKQCRTCGMDWHDPENVVCRKPPSSE